MIFDRRLQKEKQRLEDLMANLNPMSNEYAVIMARYKELTAAHANENGWKGPVLVQALGVAVSSGLNGYFQSKQIKQITKFEDEGGILTTKAMGRVGRPK